VSEYARAGVNVDVVNDDEDDDDFLDSNCKMDPVTRFKKMF
jgi:hypothetical protein